MVPQVSITHLVQVLIESLPPEGITDDPAGEGVALVAEGVLSELVVGLLGRHPTRRERPPCEH